MPFRHSRFHKATQWSLNNYSCSPPGVGTVSDSLVLFFFELFLPEGLSPVSAGDSEVAPVALSALVDFFEPLAPEVDGLPVVSAGDSVPAPCVASVPPLCRVEVPPGEVPPFARPALLGDALAVAGAEAVAAAVALGEAVAGAPVVGVILADGAALMPTLAPGEVDAPA